VCLRSFILVRFMVQVAEFNESTYDMLHPEKERASSPDCMGGPPAKCYRNSVCVCVCDEVREQEKCSQNCGFMK
jgi:hypothetical protein